MAMKIASSGTAIITPSGERRGYRRATWARKSGWPCDSVYPSLNFSHSFKLSVSASCNNSLSERLSQSEGLSRYFTLNSYSAKYRSSLKGLRGICELRGFQVKVVLTQGYAGVQTVRSLLFLDVGGPFGARGGSLRR